MNQEKIGKYISKIRKEKKMTQEELGEKLRVSSKTISRWETGKCMPDISQLMPLSEILEISVNELITGQSIVADNLKEVSEEATKKTIEYANTKVKKEKKKYKWLVIILLLVIAIILGTIDYNKVIYGEKPIFAFRITNGSSDIQHYIGLGYRIERKVKVSYKESFISSEYTKFGPWFLVWKIDIIETSPKGIYIIANNIKYQSNIGSSCWRAGKVTTCTDTLAPPEMNYDETITVSKNSKIGLDNIYGKITTIKVFEDSSLSDIKLDYKNNYITVPNKEGIYYIMITLECEQGDVWHSFKLNVTK